MKVIDLFINIANGKEVPKKVKFDNQIWCKVYGEKNIYYENALNNNDLFLYIFKHNLDFTLNDEVEIIEEEHKDNFTGMRFFKDGQLTFSVQEEPVKLKDITIEKKVEIPKHISNDYIQNLGIKANNGDIKHICHRINEIINYLQHIKKENDK